MTDRWLPEGWDHPTRVELPTGHHLRPIRADDTELDMVAVMSSQERLFSIYGKAWGWPPATMTAEQDREDLQHHADEMDRHESFNYALFDVDETVLLGCVYIDPPAKVGDADAEISWWVVDSCVGTDVEAALVEHGNDANFQPGGLGFANWAMEVEQQERELGVFFDTIVVCTVTGSTHAGMIAGFAQQERPRRVIGIDASATIARTRDQVSRIARRTAELLGLGRDLRDDEITVLEGWAGDLYGIPVRSTIDAIRLTGQLEGMIIDPVYEGKSMAGLIDLVRNGAIGPDSQVLYAHLGGQPALNAYSGLFPRTDRVEL